MLDRHLPNQINYTAEVTAWEQNRNAQKAIIDWSFSIKVTKERMKGTTLNINVIGH